MSRVDIIVPCYKYAHYLRQCVESVLSQSHGDLRVLIIDDCSPDDTETVARELVAQDSRVSYRHHETNRGHIATYNEGLDWASGAYTVLLSADDYLASGALERAVRLFEENPEIGMSYGRGVEVFQGQTEPTLSKSDDSREAWVIPSSSLIHVLCDEARNPIVTPTVVVRTDLQKNLGGYRKDLPHSGDLEMWLRFAAHAPIGFVNDLQAYYRKHRANMHIGFRDVRGFEQRRAAFHAFFDSYGQRLDNAAELRSLSDRRLAEASVWAASSAIDRSDIETCRAYLRFAETIHPMITTTKPYSRLRWKLVAGSRVWSLIRPCCDWLRSKKTAWRACCS
jgi:glycosyltransferase involved in cell wall biosynthesis